MLPGPLPARESGGINEGPFELHHLVVHAPHRESTDDEKGRVKITLDRLENIGNMLGLLHKIIINKFDTSEFYVDSFIFVLK